MFCLGQMTHVLAQFKYLFYFGLMNHKIIGLSTHDSSFKRFGRDTLLSGPYLYKKGYSLSRSQVHEKGFFFFFFFLTKLMKT